MIIEEGSFYCRFAAQLGLEDVAGQLVSNMQVKLLARHQLRTRHQRWRPHVLVCRHAADDDHCQAAVGVEHASTIACTPQSLASALPVALNIAAPDAALALAQQPGGPPLCSPVGRRPLGSEPPPLLQSSVPPPLLQNNDKWSTAALASSSVGVGRVNISGRIHRRRVTTKRTPKSILREVILSGFLDQYCQLAAVIADKNVAVSCPAMIAQMRYGFMIERQVGTD